MKKLTVPTALLLAAAFSITSGCSSTTSGQQDQAGIPVKSIKLAQSASAGLSGKIIPSEEIKIVSKLSGKVAAVHVQEGSKVQKGDVLVELETDDLLQQVKQAEASMAAAQAKLNDVQAGARPQDLQALESTVRAAQGAYEQASAAVEQAKAGFELATSAYNRLRNAYDSSSGVTQEDLDKGTLEYEKAKAGYEQTQGAQKAAAAQVQAAEAKLQLAKIGPTDQTLIAMQADIERLQSVLELANNGLNNARITAPIDGVIVKKSISPGELAQPGVQILSLVNMDQVQVELSAADSQVTQVKAGMPVDVHVQNLPDQNFQGEVTFVSPISNPNSSTFPVKVKLENKEGALFAGMIAEVSLSADSQSRMELPKSAVVTQNGKQFVYTVNNGTAHQVEVQTEEKNQDWLYVNPGTLGAGQAVIVNPTDQLAEGTKVRAE